MGRAGIKRQNNSQTWLNLARQICHALHHDNQVGKIIRAGVLKYEPRMLAAAAGLWRIAVKSDLRVAINAPVDFFEMIVGAGGFVFRLLDDDDGAGRQPCARM